MGAAWTIDLFPAGSDFVSRSRALPLGIAAAAALLALAVFLATARRREPTLSPAPSKIQVDEPWASKGITTPLPGTDPSAPGLAVVVRKLERKASDLFLRNHFGAARWRFDGIRAGLPSSLTDLLRSRDFQAWLKELRVELGPDLPAALRSLGETGSWRYRYLLTAAAAELADPTLSEFLRSQFQAREDPGLSGLAALGLARLGAARDLDALAARIRTDNAAGRPSLLTEYALAAAGSEGLRRLIDAAEDEARRGSVTLEALSSARLDKEGRLLEFCSGAQTMPLVRELALGHSNPTIRAMACQALCNSGGSDGVLLVLERLRSDPAEGVREAAGNILLRHAWSASAGSLSPEVRRQMIAAIQEVEEPEPGFRQRACFRLDAANGGTILEGALLGAREPGNRQLLFGLAEDLEEFPSDAAARIIERKGAEGALGTDPATLAFMSHVKGWSDPKLTDRLLGILENPRTGAPGSVGAAMKALSQSSATFKESEVRRIADAYRASRDDADRRVILQGLPKLGDTGWNLVLDEARSSNASQDRLSAWVALKEDARFQERPAVADEAKNYTRSFVESTAPAGAAPPVDLRFVALLRDAYLSRGATADLPFLDRLRNTPTNSDPRVPAATWDALREAAALCADTIRFREPAR
jgi:hypothetical protein